MNLNLGEDRDSVYNAISNKLEQTVRNENYLHILKDIVIQDLDLLPVPKLIDSESNVRITGDLGESKVIINFNAMSNLLSIETIDQHQKNISEIMSINKSIYTFTNNELKCFVINDHINQSFGAAIVDSREDVYDFVNGKWTYHGTKVIKYSQEDGKETKILQQEQIFDSTKVNQSR